MAAAKEMYPAAEERSVEDRLSLSIAKKTAFLSRIHSKEYEPTTNEPIPGSEKQWPFNVPLRKLGEFGVGTELYFRISWYTAVFFLLAGVIMLPVATTLASGNSRLCDNWQTEPCDAENATESFCKTVFTEWLEKPCDAPNVTIAADNATKCFITQKDYCAETLEGGEGPADEAISGNPILKTSMGHGNTFEMEIMGSMVGLLFAMIIFLLFVRRKLAYYEQKQNAINITSADYTLHIKGIPKTATSDEQLKEFMEQFGPVANVAVSLTCNKMVIALKERVTIASNLKELKAKEAKTGKDLSKETSKLEKKNQELDKKINVLGQLTTSTTGQAFVTFNQEKHLQKCVDTYKRTWWKSLVICMEPWCCGCISHMVPPKYHNCVPTVVRAPEPSDVYWENLEIRGCDADTRRFKTFVGAMVALVVSTVALVVFNQWKMAKSEDYDSTSYEARSKKYTLSIVSSCIVTGINMGLKNVIIKLTQSEGRDTVTDYQESLFRKVAFAYIMNNVVLIMIINHEMQYWYEDGGVAVQAFYLMVSNCVTPALLTLLQPFALVAQYKWESKAFTQEKLNKLYAPPPFLLGEKYASLVKTVGLGLFYGPLNPVVYFMTSATIFVDYFTNKYALLNIYKEPPKLNSDLTEAYRETFCILMLGHIILSICVLHQSGVQLLQDPETGKYTGLVEDGEQGRSISGMIFTGIALPIWFLYAILPCQNLPHLMPKEGDSGVGAKQYQDVPGLEKYECPVSLEASDSDKPIWEQDRFLNYMHGNEHSAYRLAVKQYDPRESTSVPQNV